MKKLQNSAAGFFIVSVIILSAISILGIWEIFNGDVITKSFQTLGLLATVSIIIMIAGRFVDGGKVPAVDANGLPVPEEMNPVFDRIRYATVGVLIVSVALLALLGVMSIWEVIAGPVLSKSLSSIGVVAFSSFLIIMTCLERVKHPLMHKKLSGGMVILGIIIIWIISTMLMSSFR